MDCEDDSLTLDVGDHPDISHQSYVWFAQTQNIQINPLLESIEAGFAEIRQRGSSELISRIRIAFLNSDEVPRRLKEILANAAIAERRPNPPAST
jgi:hypothetical protein